MTSPRLRRLALLAAALLVLPLSACGALSDDDGGSDSGGADDPAFEAVTIDHAFGSTEITSKPEKVVALGWGSADAAIAMGVIPVAIEEQSYGANDNGLMPWIQTAVEEQGGDLPDTLTTGESPAFQEIDEAQPDLILATYSGITEADYDKLAQIAPTVAYPDQPWSTPWRDVITTTGTALGESEKADEVLADIDAEVQAAAEAHPEFQGVSIAAVAIDPSAFYVYTPATTRGCSSSRTSASPWRRASRSSRPRTPGFFYTLSTENDRPADLRRAAVVLTTTRRRPTAVAEDPTYQKMQQFQDGTVADVVGEANVSSVSPPTALSLGYSLDTFVEALAGAVPAG